MMETQHGVVVTQLATRIPRPIYLGMKVYCVRSEESIGAFVGTAIQNELERRLLQEVADGHYQEHQVEADALTEGQQQAIFAAVMSRGVRRRIAAGKE